MNHSSPAPMHIGQGPHRLQASIWPGSGPTAILIHGIGSSGAGWNDTAPRLQTFLRPVTLDLRGHGASGHPVEGYLYDDYIDDLERTLEALEVTNPVLIGHSLGGIVALWFAARHPSSASAIIAVDAPLRSGEEFRPAFDAWIAQNAMTAEDLSRAYLDRNPEWGAERARRRAEIMTGTASGVFRELKEDSLRHDGKDRIAELTGIESPVLLIRGEPEFGSMVHPVDAVDLVDRLPHAESITISGAGHGLHRQFPDAFVNETQAFLLRHDLLAPR